MKLTKTSLNGVQFFYREGYSDIKTFIEVLSNQSYLKKGIYVGQELVNALKALS